MELQNQKPVPSGPRVTRLWSGALASDLSFIFLTVILVMLAGLPFSCVIAISMRGLFGRGLGAPLGIACFVGSIIAIMVFVERIRPRRREGWNSFRTKRLKWVMERPDVLSRVPHRFVEFHQLGHSKTSRSMMKQLSRIRPGEAILIDSLTADPLPFLRSSISFEPVQWSASESLSALTLIEPQDAGRTVEANGPVDGAVFRRRGRGANTVFGWIVILTISIGSLASASIRGQSLVSALNWSHLILAVIAASMIVAAYRHLVVGRQFFLVPGGLVRLENGLLFRTPRLALLTPKNSSLVMYRDGGVYLLTEGRPAFVTTDASMLQGLLIAWLSTARTPTLNELRTLLAQETVAAAKSANASETV